LNLTHDYPQISQLVTVSIQKLIETIERIKTNVNRTQEVNDFNSNKIYFITLFFRFKEYEQQNRQQKDFRQRIELIFEWIKQNQRFESLSTKHDLESLQREHAQLNEKQQQIQEQLKDIDTLLRNINKLD
jgi:hypothetical protein